MSDEEDKAFESARKAIADAKAAGAEVLSFDHEDFRALNRLPDEIAGLDHLKTLDLDNTQVADIAPLAGLAELKALWLNNTQVADIAPVGGLTELLDLRLNNTQVADITPLAILTGLYAVWLENTPVADITPLAGQTGLTILSLSNTQVADVSPLAGMTGMTNLWLNNTQAADISPLAGLTRLTTLRLDNTRVTDITPIAGMTEMTTLWLQDTQIANISSLAGMTGMTTLWLDNTQVADITPLAGLTGLTFLSLSNSQIADITPIAGMTRLTDLRLNNTQVASITPLTEMTGMTTLLLNNTQVADITPLAGVSALQDLTLNRAPVGNLRALRGLRQLVEEPGLFGLQFRDCAAAKADPRIAEISLIEDKAERARALFAYLDEQDEVGEKTPERDPLLEAIIVDGQLEVPPDLPGADEVEDAIKRPLHQRLRDKAEDLARAAGNNFPRLATRARALLVQVDKPFEELDLLTIHLEVEDLADRAKGATEDGIPFDDVVSAALGDVTRLGPGLTRGNDAVELFEKRLRETREAPVPEADRAAREKLSDATLAAPGAHGPNSLALEQQIRQIADQAVVDTLRKSKQRGMLWRLGVAATIGAATFGGNVAAGMVANAYGPAITAFVTTNWQTLTAAAATYGAGFAAWFVGAVGVLMMAKGAHQEIRKRKPKDGGDPPPSDPTP